MNNILQSTTIFNSPRTMVAIKKHTIKEPWLNINCQLGEAPFFDQPRNTLRFVDILAEKFHTINLSEGSASHTELRLPYSIGTTADIEGDEGRLIFGGKSGFGIMTKYMSEAAYIKKWPHATSSDDGTAKSEVKNWMRSNDGAVDSRGRYWVGMMG